MLFAQSIGGATALVRDTWANLNANYDFTTCPGRKFIVTDFGYDAEFISDGVRLIPANRTALITDLETTVGIACTFTGTTNGAITFGSALNNLIPESYVYYAANSLSASHAAGFYPTVFSSTTAAIVYNNVWVPGVGSEPVWPTSLTPFSGAVPGGTGVTTEITMHTYGLPGGLLGKYGAVETGVQAGFNNAAGGSKSVRIKIDTTDVGVTFQTTNPIVNAVHRFKNIGSESVQRGSIISNGTGSTNSYYAAVDTSADTTVSVTLKTNDPAEWGFLFYYVAKVIV